MNCKQNNTPVFKIKKDELDYRLSYFNKDKWYLHIIKGYGNVSIHNGHINVYFSKTNNTTSYIIDETRYLTLNDFIRLLGLNLYSSFSV